MKCNICLTDFQQDHYQMDSISTKLLRDIIVEIFHMQIFPPNDVEVCVCTRCEQKLHEINEFYHMVLRCHTTLLDQNLNIGENDFLQELREDEIQNALDLLGSGCELSEFETFSPSPSSNMDKGKIDENNNDLREVRKTNIAKITTKKKEKYVCDICKTTIKSKDTLKRHMLVKHLSTPVTCKKCHKLLNPSSLYLHERLQHSKTFLRITTCPVCKVHLKHERALGEHLRRIHNFPKPKSVNSFHRICESCGKIYTNKNSFYDHLRIKHPKEIPLHVTCDVCGKIFGRQHLMLKHRKTHKKFKESCPVCSRIFYDSLIYEAHVNDHDDGSVKFGCNLCPKIYTNKFSLRNHCLTRHETESKECHVCNRHLSSQNALKGHLRRVHKIYTTKYGQDVDELDKPKIIPILRQYEEVFL